MKLVWPPIDDEGKCCEKGCEDMDPNDPCKCECECEDIGAPIFLLEKGQEQYQHPAGCKSVWYEYTKSCDYEEYDEGECTWPSLEFKFTDEQQADIDEAQGKVDAFKAQVADLKIKVEQNPDSQGLPLALADAENKLQVAMDELASALAAEKFWFHSDGWVGGQGCDGYMGWYLDPETGQEMVFVKEVDPFEPDTEPHWPATFLPVEGIEIYPGSGPYYEGTEVDRPSGSECNCESSDPCPEREPRYTIDLNEDGEITSDETDLCASDDNGDGVYEYYECDPQEDCAGCMDSEKSNYDPNATTDDGSCCDEGCTQSTGDPCVYEAPNGKDACCCEENYNLPEWWFGEEPADAATVCYLEDPGVVCEVPAPE